MNKHEEPAREPKPELDDMARLLDEVAAQEMRDMRAAETLEHAPGLEKVEHVLRSAWSETAPPRPGRTWLGVLTIVGIAAAILAILWMRGGQSAPDDEHRDHFLNADERGVIYPPEKAQRWDRIEWLGPRDGTYQLQVLSDRGDLIYGPIDSIHGTVHDLPAEVAARWPAKITIEISMRQKDGTWIAAGSRTCELEH